MIFLPIANHDRLSVDHIDRNRDNNKITNLKWASTEEQARNQSHVEKKGSRRPVYQYDLKGNFIMKWDKPSEIETHSISTVSHVFSVRRGERNTAGGYIWKI